MALAGIGDLALEQGDLDRAKEACEGGLELLAHEGMDASETRLNLLAGVGWVAGAREDAGSKRRWKSEGEDHLRCGRWHWPG